MLVVLAGCGDETVVRGDESVPTSTETPAADADRELASLSVRGGLCATGDECSLVIEVSADGSWSETENGRDTSGALEGDDVEALVAAIGETTLDQGPPSAGCASAADGSDVTYTWDDAAGAAGQASSCELVLAEADPLVAWFDQFRAGRASSRATP